MFSEPEKAAYREKQLPLELKEAFEKGRCLAEALS